MIKQKKYLLILLLLIVIGGISFSYNKYVSATSIGLLNFPDFTVEKLIRSNNNSFVNLEAISLDEPEKIDDYDMLLIRVHGDKLTKTHLEAIKRAIDKGIAVLATEQDDDKINSLKGRELEYLSMLLDNPSIANYRSLFNYVRKKIDKKVFFNKAYNEPRIIPSEYFFYMGDDHFFSTYEEYQAFYKKLGKYKKDAPRVVLLSANLNPQNSNEEHFSAIINSLESKGINVYPINAFGHGKLKMIADVHPNLIISRPHGRLLMGGGEEATELLKRLNVPILAPLTVSELYDKWMKNKQGMSSGGLSSMSVVLPEIDGAVAPFAVAAQFERNGMKIFDAIPQHTNKFTRLVNNYLTLQSKPNDKKKVAIYYYKGIGKGAINAADIEGVQSLYNTLCFLKKEGYNVTNLPKDAHELEKMIQNQGSVLGPYALGAYDKFLKNGNPALVKESEFNKWVHQDFPQILADSVLHQYGEFPGPYMGANKDNEKAVAVAKLQFGNVVILPQPLPAVGSDVFSIIHGVNKAPTYPYIASYLWTRKGFNADAIIHFGTHGSLEFIPGKQVALSVSDWTDAIIGDLPHFYIYTINNIGEGIIAKRRSYAALVSHLTSPFMKSDLNSDLRLLEDKLKKFIQLSEGAVKQNYREEITKLAQKENIISALSLDSTKVLNNAGVKKVNTYLEEISSAKVIDGLYTLGENYSSENINNTASLISTDAIKYSLAQIDLTHGKVTNKQLDDIIFMDKNYTAKAKRIIKQILSGKDPVELFNSSINKKEHAIIANDDMSKKATAIIMKKMIEKFTHANAKKKKKIYLDKDGNLLPEEETEKAPKKRKGMSMMDRMAQAKPQGMNDKENSKQELLKALQVLRSAFMNVATLKNDLYRSTQLEQEALASALSGGFIHPSSAGDPIVNPSAVPTGKNFYSINPETTPSAEAWRVGEKLANNLIEAELERTNKYPKKVSFTLWATSFISSEGSTVAQILHLLGVEPLRDGFGYIRSLRLIPLKQLGRPRIDVVVQTSGQLRDIAASRLALISDAVKLAASDNSGENYIQEGFKAAEKHLLELGYSPKEARKYSQERIFGGVGGNYGTGIMGMVESGDSWEKQEEIANQYLKNMSAMYSSNGGDSWGQAKLGVFEAALMNTSVVVQPRSSNTWGPLSLDHVYEFMGGISSAVKKVTGNDPTAYFNDYRNSGRAKVQELKEAIGVETNSTVFNPKYIKEMMKGEASSMEHFAETFRNTFGWNAMKPSAIDQHIWNKYFEVYVKDSYKLGLKKTFEKKNPYALQEMTAVMLESARKGLWKASESQIKDLANLHSDLLKKHTAGCSGFICNNAKLRDFIQKNLSKESAQQYEKDIKAAREVKIESSKQDKSVVLKKENKKDVKSKNQKHSLQKKDNSTLWYVALVFVILVGAWIIIKRKKD